MDTPSDIGARVKRLRLAYGHDQKRTFAIWVGMTDQALNNYEKGFRRISIDEAMKLVVKTGVSLDWVYRGLEHTLPVHVAEKLAAVPAEEEPAEPPRRASNG